MNRLVQIFDLIVSAFLLLFVLLQPVSIAAAFITYSGAALVWLVRLALARKGMLHRSALDLPILVYWLLCAVSAVVAPLPISSWDGMRKVNLVFVVILVAHNVPSLKRARQLVGAMFLGALVSVAFAGWQLMGGVGLRVTGVETDSVFYRAGIRNGDVILRVDKHFIRAPREFFSYLASKSNEQAVRLLIVNNTQGFDVLKDAVPAVIPAGALPKSYGLIQPGIKVETERLSRARAFYSHPVTYAMVLESFACLAFGLWLASRKCSSALPRFGLLGLWLVFALALASTLTRSAWMAFALGCLFTVWFHDRRRGVRLALTAILLVATVGISAAVHYRRGVGLVDVRDPGTEYRLLMWRDGLRLIRTHPWFGVGMNTVRDAWWRFNLAAYEKYHLRLHFHSTPIQLAVMQGIPVLLAWISLMGSYWQMLLKLLKQARQQEKPLIYGLAMGIAAATIAFLVSSLVQYNFGDSVVVLQFWFLAGLAVALERQLRMGADLVG